MLVCVLIRLPAIVLLIAAIVVLTTRTGECTVVTGSIPAVHALAACCLAALVVLVTLTACALAVIIVPMMLVTVIRVSAALPGLLIRIIVILIRRGILVMVIEGGRTALVSVIEIWRTVPDRLWLQRLRLMCFVMMVLSHPGRIRLFPKPNIQHRRLMA